MSSLLLILSTFFDENSGAGSKQDYFELQLRSPQGLLDMVAGSGGRRLHGRLPQGKSPCLEAAGLRQKDTQNGFSLFLYLSKVFYTRQELLFGCGYGSDKLGVPT